MRSFQEEIKALLELVRESILEKISSGELEEKTLPKDVPDISFDYKPTGIHNVTTSTIPTKVNTRTTHTPYLIPEFKGMEEYTSTLQAFQEYLPVESKKSADSQLTTILHRFIFRLLENKELDVDFFLSYLWKDLNNDLLDVKALVYIYGITIEPELIDLTENHRLRRPIKDDMALVYSLMRREYTFPHEYPTAVLEIIEEVQSPREMQRKIFKSIATLRLLNVNSVNYIAFKTFSNSVLGMYGPTQFTTERRQFGIVHITNEETESLQLFYSEIFNSLPEKFTETGQIQETDYVPIAFTRYNDALFHSAATERRITDTIMGFEALFLNENTDLKYRVMTRLLKFLSLIDQDWETAEKLINLAYKIRNDFAHGKILSSNYRSRIVALSLQEDAFIRSLLDILRKCMIILTLWEIDKKHLIKRLDSALISQEESDRLKNDLQVAVNFI